MTTTTLSKPKEALWLPHAALLFWGLMLVTSTLPVILWQELLGRPAAWLLPARVVLLVALLAASFLWRGLRTMRPFVTIFLVLFLAEWLSGQVGGTVVWQRWFNPQGSFTTSMLGNQLLRLGVSLTMVATLFLLTRNRADFFLTLGNPRAAAQPVRWLGMDQPMSWLRFGPICIVAASASLLIFLFLAARPAFSVLRQAVPLFPFILLFAMMNAWSEEISYRATLIATSERVIGAAQALGMSAIYFGLGHYYGVPYGIVGVLLSTFFGYLLGKGMLETRGLLWSWLIHVVADIWIFSFMAVGSITPGG